MSNVVFSFDAQVAGVIAGVDAMMAAFSELESAAQSLVSSFAGIASQWATMSTGLGSLIQNFGALSGSMDDGSTSMASASGSASNLAYQLQQLSERAADAARAHADMVQQIEQQEADATQTFNEQVQQRQETYDESLQKLIENHQYAMQQIQQQEDDLTNSYQDTIDKRLVALGDPRALQHQALVQALQQQIDALISTGHADQAQALENQLTSENSSYQKYIQTTIEPYYQYLDQKGYTQHQEALARLQDRLSKEQQSYDQQLAYLKKHYSEEMSLLDLHYKQEEQRLQQHLAKENQSYAEQVQRINEERAHLLGSGGGGGGGGSVAPFGSPPTDAFIQLFKRLGINTSTPQGAIEATNALQAWLTGGSFNGVNFGVGYAPNSQMSVQQLWSVITQEFAYGQDPTKNLGGGNLLDVVSNLMGMAQLVNGKGPGQAFNSILSIFEKAESGNTIGLERQLAALGISPELLARYGVQFGGRGGKTIMNPGAVLGALEQIGLSPGFVGLGQKLSEDTPQGAIQRFRDFGTGIVQQIMGGALDPGSLMHRFMHVVNELFAFLFRHQGQIIAFGKTVVTWLIDKFQNFVTWLQGSQAKALLHDIGDGFKKIGDALHWLGQHQGVLHLLLMLLGMQVGGKLLGGLAGGIMGVGGGLLSGGPLGMIGGAASSLMGSGPMVNFLLSHFGALTPGAALGGIGSGILGGIGSRFNNASYFAQWVGDHAAMMRQHGGIGSIIGAYGPMPPGVGIFQHLANNTGAPVGAARMAGLLSDPLTSLAQMGGNLVEGVRGFIPGLALLGQGAGIMGGNAAAGVMGAVGNMANIFTAGGGGLGGIGALLGAGGSGALGMLSSLGPALLGVAAAAGPILLVAGAVAGLIAVLVMNRDKIMPFLHMLGDFFGAKLKQAMHAIGDFVHQVQERLGPAFGPGSLVYKGVMLFAAMWSGAWNGIKTTFEGVWSVIEGVIKVVWSIISGIILIGLDLLGGKWGQAWDDLKKMVGGVFDGIGTIIHGALLIILGLFQTVLGGIWGVVQHIFGNIGNFIGNVWNGIKTAAIDLFGLTIPGIIINLWPQIQKVLGNIGTGIGNFFTQTIPNAINGLWQAILSAIKHIIDMLINTVLPGPLQGPVHSALGFEHGGHYPGRAISIVGEAGPELFFSEHPGAVVSNSQIRDALLGVAANGGGMRPIVITGDVCVVANDPKDFYQKMNTMAGRRAEYGNRGSAT